MKIKNKHVFYKSLKSFFIDLGIANSHSFEGLNIYEIEVLEEKYQLLFNLGVKEYLSHFGKRLNTKILKGIPLEIKLENVKEGIGDIYINARKKAFSIIVKDYPECKKIKEYNVIIDDIFYQNDVINFTLSTDNTYSIYSLSYFENKITNQFQLEHSIRSFFIERLMKILSNLYDLRNGEKLESLSVENWHFELETKVKELLQRDKIKWISSHLAVFNGYESKGTIYRNLRRDYIKYFNERGGDLYWDIDTYEKDFEKYYAIKLNEMPKLKIL